MHVTRPCIRLAQNRWVFNRLFPAGVCSFFVLRGMLNCYDYQSIFVLVFYDSTLSLASLLNAHQKQHSENSIRPRQISRALKSNQTTYDHDTTRTSTIQLKCDPMLDNREISCFVVGYTCIVVSTS